MGILTECKSRNFNRVEVLLHMIQILVIDAQQRGVINVPPPILSRVYQTLSRGFVNLLNAKKIKDTRFPFPYAQVIAVLLLLLSIFTPLAMTSMLPQGGWCVLGTFVPVFGLLSLNYIAEELEMPFGEDHNDLPLTHFQEEMNSSLMMLLHECSDHVASICDRAQRDFATMSSSLHDARNSIDQLDSVAYRRKSHRASVFLRASSLAREPMEPGFSSENGFADENDVQMTVKEAAGAPETTIPSILKSSNGCSSSAHVGETPSTTTPRTQPSQSTMENTLSSTDRESMTESCADAALSSALAHESSSSANCGMPAEHVNCAGALLRAVTDLPAQNLDESRYCARHPQGLDWSRSTMPNHLVTAAVAEAADVPWRSEFPCPCPQQPDSTAMDLPGLDDASCEACPAFCQVQEVDQPTIELKNTQPLQFSPPSPSPSAKESRRTNAVVSQPVEIGMAIVEL